MNSEGSKWWGECPCQAIYKTGIRCREVARYTAGGKTYCGIHSKKATRKELPKNPQADANEQSRLEACKRAAAEHALLGVGSVTATKMRMMKNPIPKPNHLAIFPNNKHAHGYGYGAGDFSGLSPMRLGPVMDNGTVLALNIENYHQFAKVFPQEMTNEPCDCALATRGIPHMKASPAFYSARTAAYADPVPHRHKFEAATIKRANKAYVQGVNAVNTPMFAVQFVHGEERHYSYVESRYFYCTQMEQLASQTAAYAQLVEYLVHGYALEIFGYDAYEPDGVDPESLYRHYCDPSRPFGHEMVILTLLALTADDYPWRRFARANPGLYE